MDVASIPQLLPSGSDGEVESQTPERCLAAGLWGCDHPGGGVSWQLTSEAYWPSPPQSTAVLFHYSRKLPSSGCTGPRRRRPANQPVNGTAFGMKEGSFQQRERPGWGALELHRGHQEHQ